MIIFCKDLKEQAMEIINYDKKRLIPLIDKEKKTHENQKVCYIWKKNLVQIKSVVRLEIIVII